MQPQDRPDRHSRVKDPGTGSLRLTYRSSLRQVPVHGVRLVDHLGERPQHRGGDGRSAGGGGGRRGLQEPGRRWVHRRARGLFEAGVRGEGLEGGLGLG